ncbi:winged helix-turn-helix transcriptional regulator [Methanosphaerula palustris]|uniref:Transcriptional regulator, HxlR family n=1 Tax=Methanosphaerula palustris (strain ATCC BAA-1556 / DSM 19958 / E1-9c) TaxID=521011 RepID=B8GEP6_METPE|nr:helix-turn-helix domain-containing protein [Methanosphaerula palustris]ACL17747.1 transcriptional regulator, HxlR family [Methanosphaerula palustris E1-9c]
MKCEKAQKCNLENIVDIIGSKWNLFIIWHLRTKKLRFTELQNRMCGINSKTITRHLRDLEGFMIIDRRVYPEVPPRVEYSLTERGTALLPIIEAMLEWGGQYLNAKPGESHDVEPAKETVCEMDP